MKKFIKEIIPYVIIIIVVVLIRTFIITPVRVTGPSMSPTLKDGDIMLLYKLTDIKRNDIVVIDTNTSTGFIIKRVIGLPNETVEYSDGSLFINGKKVDDNYGSGKTEDFEKVKLDDDEYFVMGDNRLWSEDSRSTTYGPIKNEQIVGTTNLIIFPFKNLGKVD